MRTAALPLIAAHDRDIALEHGNRRSATGDDFSLHYHQVSESGATCMPNLNSFTLKTIGFVRSGLKRRRDAPRQGREGGPSARLEIAPAFTRGLHRIAVGQDLILITWLHQADRTTLRVHPRSDKNLPITGVFATRSPDRPNPLGLHRVTVLEIAGSTLRVEPLEAIDGTPIVDIKPILCPQADS